MTDVFFYVQHLFGIGHLRRAVALAGAMHAAGLEVVLASGGFPVPGLDLGGARLVQLPPLRTADERFRTLLDAAGRPIDEAGKAARRAALLAAFAAARPRVLITEMFPFGRRQLRFELSALLEAAEAARPRPRVVASVRDVLVDKPAERTAWMAETARRHYDLVLVHGDPALIPFAATFAQAERISDRLRYTGYVVSEPPTGPAPRDAQGEVLVSAGGGAFGRALIERALAARPLSPLATAPWRVLVGPNLPEADFQDLRRYAAEGVRIERARDDFQARLAQCRLSISQAGYNTVMETLRARAPAVLVPFAGGGESEQRRRARLLAERGLVTLVDEAAPSPAALAAAIRQAVARGRPQPPSLALDGARVSAEIVRDLAAIVRTP